MIRLRHLVKSLTRPNSFWSTRMSTKSSADSDNFEECQDLSQIRAEFKNLEGGAVTLTKNDSNGIALICLDHQIKKNGFSGKMMVDLNEVVNSLENWSTGKGVILYGKGDMFCSGGDLDTVKQICTSEGGYKMSKLMQDSTTRLRRLPLVSVSIVHGMAIGGGAELTLSTDYRLMTANANLAFVQAKMGVATGWGGGYALTKLIGHTKALDLLLKCRKVPSDEALALGLVDQILSDTDGATEESRVKAAIDFLGQRINQHDPSIAHAVKQIVQCENLDEERRAFAKVWGGPIQHGILAQNIKHK